MGVWWKPVALATLLGNGACLSSNPSWDEPAVAATTTDSDADANASTTSEMSSATSSTDTDEPIATLCDRVECGLGGTCVVDVASENPAPRCDCPAGAVDAGLQCAIEAPVFASCGETTRIGDPGGTEIQGPLKCPFGTYATGLYTEYDKNDRLKGFKFHCHSLIVDPDQRGVQWDQATSGGSAYGDADTEYSQNLDCPQDEYLIALRAYFGAFVPDPTDFRVMDRLEVGCSPLTWDAEGNFSTGEPTWIAQELMGSEGLLDYAQEQQAGRCAEPGIIAILSTSGGGHTDHFDIECSCPGLGD